MRAARFLFCILLTTSLCAQEAFSPAMRLGTVALEAVALGAIGGVHWGPSGIVLGAGAGVTLGSAIDHAAEQSKLSVDQKDYARVAGLVCATLLVVVRIAVGLPKCDSNELGTNE